jgi:hypothetical protein
MRITKWWRVGIILGTVLFLLVVIGWAQGSKGEPKPEGEIHIKVKLDGGQVEMVVSYQPADREWNESDDIEFDASWDGESVQIKDQEGMDDSMAQIMRLSVKEILSQQPKE